MIEEKQMMAFAVILTFFFAIFKLCLPNNASWFVVFMPIALYGVLYAIDWFITNTGKRLGGDK